MDTSDNMDLTPIIQELYAALDGKVTEEILRKELEKYLVTYKTGVTIAKDSIIRKYRNKNYTEVWRYGGNALAFDPASSVNPWTDVARQVIRGDYGNGADRINALRKARYTIGEINKIQQTVNYILRGVKT